MKVVQINEKSTPPGGCASARESKKPGTPSTNIKKEDKNKPARCKNKIKLFLQLGTTIVVNQRKK